MHNLTKELFAGELEAMLNEMPFGKVRVTELCRRCEVSPQAFYYHFKDKYDLVTWMFLRDFEFEGCQGSLEDLVTALERMWAHREFYNRAFDIRSQNSLLEYLPGFFAGLAGENLTDTQMVAVWYDACGTMGLLWRWMKGDVKASPHELADFLVSAMPPFMRDATAAM